MSTVLYANDSSYAGLSFIANYIPDSVTLLAMSARKDFDAMIDNKLYLKGNPELFKKHINSADHIIVFSIYSLAYLNRYVLKGSIPEKCKKFTVIISDSKYVKDYAVWNKYIKENNIEVLIMPDLIHLLNSGIEYRPYLQHVPLEDYKIEKNKEITIAHSPGLKYKINLKGTVEITRQLKGMNLDVIYGEDWHKCVERKSKAHFFVDQMVDRVGYKGGMGKSGIEGMMLGCLTITSGVITNTEPHFPIPPVVLCRPKELRKTVQYYIDNKDKYQEKVKEQQDWAKKYLSRDFVLKNILGE